MSWLGSLEACCLALKFRFQRRAQSVGCQRSPAVHRREEFIGKSAAQVLQVEDDPQMADLLKPLIETAASGTRMQRVSEVDAGERAVDNQVFDLISCDWNLPAQCAHRVGQSADCHRARSALISQPAARIRRCGS